MNEQELLKHLVKRLSRLDDNNGWGDDLNPVQQTTLDYLARANKFSRQPSIVAQYLGSTRGTVSQTLKSLADKGYIEKIISATDKRSIMYDLTMMGQKHFKVTNGLQKAIENISANDLRQTSKVLQQLLSTAIEENAQKPFGICKSCIHFQSKTSGGHCNLLNETLLKEEISQICHEQKPH